MKKYLQIIILNILPLYSFSQILNLQEYQVTSNYEEIGTVGINDNRLFFNLFNLTFLDCTDTVKLKTVDSIFYECRLLDIATNTEKKVKIKSGMDTLSLCWTHTPYYNKHNFRYYFGSISYPRLSLDSTTTNSKIGQNYIIESFDTNMSNRNLVPLQLFSNSTGYAHCNKIIQAPINGSQNIFAISADTADNANPYLCKLNLNSGQLLDTLKLIDKFANGIPFGDHSAFIKMDWVNDSILIVLSDYLHYVNVNTMKLIDTAYLEFSIWQDYNTPTSVIFNEKDTSYIYCNTDLYKVFYYQVNKYGKAKKIFELPFDNLQLFKTNLINTQHNNFDYKYYKHIYTATNTLIGTDTMVLTHSDSNGTTDWVKLIKLPGISNGTSTIALEDSSVFIFSHVRQPGDPSKLDVYYLRVDQYGNQVYPVEVQSDFYIINEVQIFPNPASSSISIANISLDEIEKITLNNLNGQIAKVFEKNLVLDISALPPSTYILHITTKKGQITKQIIKH